MNYIEEYKIADRYAGISIDDDKFKVWVGGCKINTSSSLTHAREALTIYITAWINNQINIHERETKKLQREIQELIIHPAGIMHFITKYSKKQG